MAQLFANSLLDLTTRTIDRMERSP